MFTESRTVRPEQIPLHRSQPNPLRSEPRTTNYIIHAQQPEQPVHQVRVRDHLRRAAHLLSRSQVALKGAHGRLPLDGQGEYIEYFE